MVFNRENFDTLLKKQEVLNAEIDRLRTEIKLLNEKVQFLVKQQFGRSSEKLNPDQLLMAFDELQDLQEALDQALQDASEPEEEEEPKNKSKRGKRKPLKERIPDDLPVETEVIIPQEVLDNPELYEEIGEETLEELDVTPTHFFRRIIIRKKYKRLDDRTQPPLIEKAPERLIPNSYATVGLVLHILLGKYCDHLPLYRQEQIFKNRFGIEISRKTMGNWMYLIADWLAMIYEALRNEIRGSGYIQADETYIRYIDPEKDSCPNGYLWAYHSPGAGVLFEWYPSRAAECLDEMLEGYEGLLQTDGYVGYTSWLNQPEHAAEKEQIIHAACWTHARRKFVEAPGYPAANEIVLLIKKLYRIETKLRQVPELDRAAYRQEYAAPILEEIKERLEHEAPRQLPKSKFGQAIQYTLTRWDQLTLYLQHSKMEIDNNLVENAIRPTAIGKKNFLFFGSPTSGQTSAVIYSLIETCRKLDINPADYLREVLTALPTMMSAEAANWTPAKWNERRKMQESKQPELSPTQQTLPPSFEAA